MEKTIKIKNVFLFFTNKNKTPMKRIVTFAKFELANCTDYRMWISVKSDLLSFCYTKYKK